MAAEATCAAQTDTRHVARAWHRPSKYFKYFPIGLEHWAPRHRCCRPRSRRSAVVVEAPAGLGWVGYRQYRRLRADLDPFLASVSEERTRWTDGRAQ